MNLKYELSRVLKAVRQAPVKKILVSEVRRFEGQPRMGSDPDFFKELVNTIKAGQAYPVIVLELSKNQRERHGYKYELVDGECRWKACKEAGLLDIDAKIIALSTDKNAQYLLSVVTNTQRGEFTPLEYANIIQHFKDLEINYANIGRLLGGRSTEWVCRHAKISRLEQEAQVFVGPRMPKDERLSVEHCALIDQLPAEKQARMAKIISKRKLTVALAEQRIKMELRNNGNATRSTPTEILQRGKTGRNHNLKRTCRSIRDCVIFFDRLLDTSDADFNELFGSCDQRVRADLVGCLTKISEGATQVIQGLKRVPLNNNQSVSAGEHSHNAGDVEVDENTGNERGKNIECLTTARLLKMIGVPQSMLYKTREGRPRKGKHKNFWERDVEHLEVLGKVRELYLKKVKSFHPDTASSVNGNSNKDDLNEKTATTATLNRIYQTLERRFKLHGYQL